MNQVDSTSKFGGRLTAARPAGFGERRRSLLDVKTRQRFHERRERTSEQFVAAWGELADRAVERTEQEQGIAALMVDVASEVVHDPTSATGWEGLVRKHRVGRHQHAGPSVELVIRRGVADAEPGTELDREFSGGGARALVVSPGVRIESTEGLGHEWTGRASGPPRAVPEPTEREAEQDHRQVQAAAAQTRVHCSEAQVEHAFGAQVDRVESTMNTARQRSSSNR